MPWRSTLLMKINSYINYLKYFILGITHFGNVLRSNAVGIVHDQIYGVGYATRADWNPKSKNIDVCWTHQMIWAHDVFISCVCY